MNYQCNCRIFYRCSHAIDSLKHRICYGGQATVIALLVAVLVYAAALLLLGGLTEEEILSMPKGAALGLLPLFLPAAIRHECWLLRK